MQTSSRDQSYPFIVKQRYFQIVSLLTSAITISGALLITGAGLMGYPASSFLPS